VALAATGVPIGGVKEKTLAALRAGIDTVLLPARNKKVLEEIPEAARKQLNFVWLENIDDALSAALGTAEHAANGGEKAAA
jgi:ATP-dependent Lon protease